MSLRTNIAIATIAAGSMLASDALADNQFNAGAGCVVDFGSGGMVEYGGIRAGVSNGGTSTLYLLCPISRGAFGPNGTMAVKVFAIDRNSTSDVCCTGYHANAGSGSFYASPQACTTGSSTNYQSIDVTVPNFAGTWDYAFVLCTVPPVEAGSASIITGYRGIEQ